MVWGLVGLALVYGGICAAMTLAQRSLLYFPARGPRAPAEVGLPQAEARTLTSGDGERIDAWFLPGPEANARLALYLHGNGGSLQTRPDRLAAIRDLGLAVLAIDYRGYGGSSGSPTEAGLHLDAEAGYQEALRRGFAPGRIVVIGESLGSGLALRLATRHPVAGVLLDSPYSAIVDVAADRYWMLPVRWLMVDTYRSDLWIGSVTAPILMLHGTQDRTIPLRYARRLASLAGSRAELVELAGEGHVVLDSDAAAGPVRAWLGRLDRPAAP